MPHLGASLIPGRSVFEIVFDSLLQGSFPPLLDQMLQEVLNSIARERPLVVAVGCAHGKHRIQSC